MKRKAANEYSDGYDGNYQEKRPKTMATTGIFYNTRKAQQKNSINNLLRSDSLLSVIRHCDYLALLLHTPRVCKHWNSLICNPVNRKSILYRAIGKSLIEVHCIKGNFRFAQDICENADHEIEYFQKLNNMIIEKIIGLMPLYNSMLDPIERDHAACIPYIRNILKQQPTNALHLNVLQDHIPAITNNLLSFMDKEIHFQQGYPIIIANIFLKLIPAFGDIGKINIAKDFLRFLLTQHATFIKLLQQEFTHYFNIIKCLCADPSLEVKKEAVVIIGLMASLFPKHEDDTWILFLDTLQSDPELTKHIISIIKNSEFKERPNFPDQLSILIMSNDKSFISCFQKNSSKFTNFLEDLFSCDVASVKTSAATTLLIITFNEQLIEPIERECKLRTFEREFRKDPDLFQNIIDKSGIPLTPFKNKLKEAFPLLAKQLK